VPLASPHLTELVWATSGWDALLACPHVELAHVFHDPLGDFALGLQRFHCPARFLQQVLEPRQLGEHMIDHRLLLANALERNLHVAQKVDDGVGLALTSSTT
jgi:hypothetical protein